MPKHLINNYKSTSKKYRKQLFVSPKMSKMCLRNDKSLSTLIENLIFKYQPLELQIQPIVVFISTFFNSRIRTGGRGTRGQKGPVGPEKPKGPRFLLLLCLGLKVPDRVLGPRGPKCPSFCFFQNKMNRCVYKTKNNAQTIPKQLQSNFEKTLKTTFLNPNIAKIYTYKSVE